MSLKAPSVILLMNLCNKNLPADKHFTAETFSVTNPIPFFEPTRPEYNTRVSVAYREDPMLRWERYYIRPAIEHVGRNADVNFEVPHGATLADILEEVNLRLGTEQQLHEFKELAFFESGEYVLEPTPENLLLIGAWRINVTVTGAPSPVVMRVAADGDDTPPWDGAAPEGDAPAETETDVADDQAPPAETEVADQNLPEGEQGAGEEGDEAPAQDITEEQASAIRAFLAEQTEATYYAYHAAFNHEVMDSWSAEAGDALLLYLIEQYPALSA